ncbi:poly [ADP-ribose] polymerase 1 isoform X3 [Arachis ipaensis]|uniref:poly [ADP-ribose] polymerase 1 isoform X3 n=1 Tax=Arachis ipaensis TaxID=130454 RepID=UPI000A2B274F|nr:poly [ADP-ribose] polymerase 1 isoform X3 [Arachis ipaensis]XP_025665811.1 poly [ADP-ribose] polymerase 1 isoform X3 [Arachis hypogaea]
MSKESGLQRYQIAGTRSETTYLTKMKFCTTVTFPSATKPDKSTSIVISSCYSVMQLIMVPEKHLHLFFKKARAGDNPNAEERLEEFDNVDNALKEFTRLFEENNGNQFEPWERDEKFCKKPLKFYPIDMVCANGDGLRLARPSHRNGCTASLEKMVRIASWPRLVESMFPKWRLLLLRSNMFEFTAKQRIFQS